MLTGSNITSNRHAQPASSESTPPATSLSQAPLANSQGQLLTEHLLGVALYARELLGSLGLAEKKFQEIAQGLVLACLFHDIGKNERSFQNYINSLRQSLTKKRPAKNGKKSSVLAVSCEESGHDATGDLEVGESGDFGSEEDRKSSKAWNGVYHQEWSWAFLNYCLAGLGDKLFSQVAYGVYWHHETQMKDKVRRPARERLGDVAPDRAVCAAWMEFATSLLARAGRLFLLPSSLQLCLRDANPETAIPRFKSERADGPEQVTQDATKTLILQLLIQADRVVSGLSPAALSAYIASFEAARGLTPVPLSAQVQGSNCWRDLTLKADMAKTARTKEQSALAAEVANGRISIVGADPASGKTLLSLLIKKAIGGCRRLLFVVPETAMVDSLFFDITGELERFETASGDGGRHPSVQAVHGGKIQAQTQTPGRHEGIFASDVNITTFDRFLSPSYRRDQVSEFVAMLLSDLVVDEFHFLAHNERFIPTMLEVLVIRSWMETGAKTILMSGTPDPALLRIILPEGLGGVRLFPRTCLSPAHENTRMLTFSACALNPGAVSGEDVMTCSNRIEEAQEGFVSYGERAQLASGVLVHSKKAKTDRLQTMKTLFRNFGRNAVRCIQRIAAATSLQASLNFSVAAAHVSHSHPNSIGQYLGRNDRFGDKVSPTFTIYAEAKMGYFNDNRFGFRKTVEAYQRYLLRVLVVPLKATHREAMVLLYDKFWDEPGVLKAAFAELSGYVTQARTEMAREDLWPYKYAGKSGGKGAGKGRPLFRDGGILVSAKKYDQSGNLVGMISGEDLLTVSMRHEQKLLLEIFPSGSSDAYIEQLNADDLFCYSKSVVKHRSYAIGRDAELPTFYSHIDPVVHADIVRELGRRDEEPRVYHPTLGLTTEERMARYLAGNWKKDGEETSPASSADETVAPMGKS